LEVPTAATAERPRSAISYDDALAYVRDAEPEVLLGEARVNREALRRTPA